MTEGFTAGSKTSRLNYMLNKKGVGGFTVGGLKDRKIGEGQ